MSRVNRTRLHGRVALLVVATAAVVASACNELTGGDANHISILHPSGGNGQVSFPDTELPGPISVRLLSPLGAPRVGVTVHWSVNEGGSITAESITDRLGVARAVWTLGPRAGNQVATAVAGDQEVRFRAQASDPMPVGVVRRLNLKPLPGSDEFVHPDVARVPSGWGSARRYLAITPYPGGDITQENPFLFASGARSTWEAPQGLTNPVTRVTHGYLSDPDVVFEPDRKELWLYYRRVRNHNSILLTTSTNGTTWNRASTVVRAPNHMAVSPAVVRVAAGNWHMWTVNSGPTGCQAQSTFVEHRTSSDGVHWSEPTPVDLGADALPPWHVDVYWAAEFKQFWALFNGKPPGTCATPALFLATSEDGISWRTLPTPVLERGFYPPFQDVVYRSSLSYDARTDLVTVWYSGARYIEPTWIWSSAVERIPREDLFSAVRERPGAQLMIEGRKLPPLLIAP